MSGLFHATAHDADATTSVLSIVEAPDRKSLLIDDVVLEPVVQDCSELLMNGNADMGDTAMFWTTYLTDGGAQISLVSNNESGNIFSNENKALKVSSRSNVGDGLAQVVDHRCLESGSTWRLTARMRLIHRGLGTPVACDPSSTRLDTGCPPVRVVGHDEDGIRQFEGKFNMNSSGQSWQAESMNAYEVDIPVSSELASCHRVMVSIRTYNLAWDVVVDNLSLTQVSG